MTGHSPSQDQDLRTALEPDHEFKSHPDVFWPAVRGEKMFEFRKDDRGGYSVCQTVRLRCYDPDHGYYGHLPLDRRITNILRGGEFGLQEGYCVLSLAPLTPAQAPAKAGEREGLVAQALETFQQRDGYHKAVIVEILEDFGAVLLETAALAPQTTGTEASQGVIPAGWKLVPVEPTDGMIQAFDRAWWAKTQDVSSPTPTEHPEDGGGPVGYGWRAALAATPPTPASTAQCDEMSKAACDVLAERRRQVEVEGWTSEHDDAHDGGEMAIAAACYATAPPATYTEREWMFADRPKAWPWHSTWWKPTFYRCNLVKAGALIVAEIERLDRRGVAASPAPPLSPDSTGPAGRPIDEAPRDGTPIIAWGAPRSSEPDDYEWRQTRWTLYGEGSIAHARFKAGQGPEGYWSWSEPMHNWGSSWEPTRFIDLPALTPSAPIAAPKTDSISWSPDVEAVIQLHQDMPKGG